VSGSILLLAHKRPEILQKTILALSKADRTGISEMVVVIQGRDPEVLKLVKNINWISYQIISTNYPEGTSAKEAINRNLHLGLKHSFSINANEYVVVLEDDICVSRDFFSFVKASFEQNSKDKYFRAINCFSGVPRAETSTSNYGKYRFGVGWGWVLPRRTWDDLKGIWHGDEDEHWDGLLESFMKTGYTVAPGMSRILNIGFGDGATHTNAANDPFVLLTQQKIDASYVDSHLGSDFSAKFHYVPGQLNWREDCREFMYPDNPRGLLIQSLYICMDYLQRASFKAHGSDAVVRKVISILRRVAFRLD
jgi:hypothetical protein